MKIIFIIIFIILIFVIIHQKKKEILLLNTMSNYEKVINEQGETNHEYKNQLIILKGYIDNKKELKKYLDSLIEDHKTGKHYEIRQLSRLDNPGLKELLYYKINKMKKYKINYCLYISDFTNDYLNKIDFVTFKDITKIVGVIIDNAIEASCETLNKELFIYFNTEKRYLSIKVVNSIKDTNNLDKIGKNKYTTKGKGHGYGLLLLKDIVYRNKRIELVSDYDNDYYTQTILIDIK